MKKSRRFFLAILIAALSFIAVLVGLSLTVIDWGALPENASVDSTASATPPPTATSLPIESTDSLPAAQTPTAESPTNTPSPAPTAQPIVLLIAEDCPPPPGWTEITVKRGDTLSKLAEKHETTPNLIAVANCLEGDDPKIGTEIYVPNVTTTGTGHVPAPAACRPPPDWVARIVQEDDNLFRIGLEYDVSVAALQAANCLGDSTIIRTGQKIYVPNR